MKDNNSKQKKKRKLNIVKIKGKKYIAIRSPRYEFIWDLGDGRDIYEHYYVEYYIPLGERKVKGALKQD